MNSVPASQDSPSLTTRAFVITLLVALAVTVSALTVVGVSNNRDAKETVRRGLEQSADLVAQFLVARERTLVGGARVFVQGPSFRTLVAARHRDDVLDQAIEAADQIGADWVFITDENGVLIAKSDEPGVTGVPMGQVALIAGALRGQTNTGFGASGDTMVFQAVAVPISAKLGAPAGVLVATRIVDSLFLHDVKAATASDLLFYSRDEKGRGHPAASTLHASAGELAAFLRERSTDDEKAERSVALGDVQYLSRGAALSTAGGEVVGGFLVLRSRDAVGSTLSALRTPLAVALVVGLLGALLARYAMTRYVARPARMLATSVTNAANGRPDLASSGRRSDADGASEINALSYAFQSLVADLRDKEALIAVARMTSASAGESGPAPNDAEPGSKTFRTSAANRSAVRAPLQRQITRPGLVLEPGSVLANRYLIEAEVGRGGLGIVYRAHDNVLADTIAVKVLRPELVMSDASAFEGLKRELRITRRLSHRNIVRTHDIGETEAAPFLTMEYVDGASLSTVIQARGSLSRAAVLAMAKQLLGALAVAHDHAIVHGDLKPQNLLIDANGLLKVTDFGVARLVRGARPARSTSDDAIKASGGSRLSGAVLGTPEYMAPEQLIGEPSSILTDIYAAGVVLQECLTGSTPYQADTPVAFVARKLGTGEHDVQAPNHSVSPSQADIARLVEFMTNPRAEQRPTSARELLSLFAALG